MSKANFLEKLLDGADVEWLPLDDLIISLKTGLNPRKNFKLNTVDAEGYYVTVREIQNGNVVFLDKTDRVNNEALRLINNRSNLEKGDILFSGTGTVGRTAVIEAEPKNWDIKEGVYVIKPRHEVISSGYLSHLLNSSHIIKAYSKKVVGSPVVSLPMKELKKLLFPIPCPDDPKKSLEIQAEIVRILDAFTALTAELTAELTARKKQYNYYRDQLLTFDEGDVAWKPLGELGELVRGNGLPKTDFTEQGVPAIHYGQIYTYYGLSTTSTLSFVSPKTAEKLRKVNTGDVIVTNTSENFEDVGKALVYLGEEQAVTGGHATIFKPSDAILGKYFAYFSQTAAFEKSKRKYAKGAKVIDVSANDMAKIDIPIPYANDPQKSLAEQARIVDILDKFDALTNSISEGLPREIELRQTQYEYYRDLLLNFPKPMEETA